MCWSEKSTVAGYSRGRCDAARRVSNGSPWRSGAVMQLTALTGEAARCLMPGVELSRLERCVHLRFSSPHKTLSSAVLNGGYCAASDFLNVRVPRHCPEPPEDPAITLQRLSDELQCRGTTVAMMTAASLDSLRVASGAVCGETLAVLVTTGLENARRAGDPAEYRTLDVEPAERGTINLAIVTSARIADAALVEMVAIATEAKAAVLQELCISSPVSGGLATGTGTDAIAVFSGHGAAGARFAGKHTLLGERLAVMVMDAIRSSVNYQQAPAA